MKKLFASALFATCYILAIPNVFAIVPGGGGGGSDGFSIGSVFQPAQRGGFNTFGELATSILTILTSAAGVIAVFFIIIGGLKLVTASGDEKKMASASATITYAIIGLVVTALAFVILQVVQYLLGANVGTI